MTPFLKYSLINLLFLVLLTAAGYRFLKTRSAEKTVVSSQPEDRILEDAQQSDTLYRTYKLALKGTDPIALVQAKGNFQVKMLELKQRPLTTAPLDSIFGKMARNYYSLITVNENKMKNQKALEVQKLEMKDKIEKLTRLKERTEGLIDNLSIQPIQAPAVPAIPK
jgi:hypothetical protein